MGLFDKVKDMTARAAEMAGDLSQSAKEEYEKTKLENERKKAEKEAYKNEMTEKAGAGAAKIVEEIRNSKYGEGPCIFNGMDEKQLCNFTKDFYEKMVLPGSKASSSCILMFPYIDDKKKKSLHNAFPGFSDSEKPVLYIHDSDKQEFLFTTEKFYFKTRYAVDRSFFCSGEVEISYIDAFAFEISSEVSRFTINGVAVAEITVCSTYRQDFMALNEYNRALREKDFVIEPTEIDRLIHQKLGDGIYQQIKKYMVYEDELILYYASGSDSLLASDYIACTNKQIIIVDREAFGVTSDVKQFYYEDITSMSALQNSNDSDLLGFIIDTALTAALKTCDLVITVAGSRNKINILYKIEAERVIAIYHQYRKEAKKAAVPVQTVIQKNEPDALDMLMKLAKLKESGIITEEEFAAKKAELLTKI